MKSVDHLLVDKRTVVALCLTVLALVFVLNISGLPSATHQEIHKDRVFEAPRSVDSEGGEALPWMDLPEIDVIEEYLRPDKTMLEWGSGRSTFYFSRFVHKYYSIESDAGWCSTVQQQIQSLNLTDKIKIICIARTFTDQKQIGIPSSFAEYEKYIHAVDLWNVKAFDLVLIDGRARPQCALKVVPYLHKDSVVFIHDWSRSYYHVVLDAYDVITETYTSNQDGGGLIAALRLKPEQIGTKGTLHEYPDWWF
eukprot:TRINITY_DN6803_c0_g1_i6.p1 TRINITY_DN6803_c0_g1~~TRINITY_DN6803_c0_g1_i6.p1  ORF type:complete len:252 (+),score=47.82 TRINITY_DN6803_c0_g1_i6:49-804(+)